MREHPARDAIAVPPEWIWSVFSGTYKHLGTELSLGNSHLHKKGVVKGDGEIFSPCMYIPTNVLVFLCI